jgi:hypothetical protein
MLDGFGESAARLCGAASAVLGWRPNEFWEATPAELASALRPMAEVADSADADTLEQLRRRFPDESKA